MQLVKHFTHCSSAANFWTPFDNLLLCCRGPHGTFAPSAAAPATNFTFFSASSVKVAGIAAALNGGVLVSGSGEQKLQGRI